MRRGCLLLGLIGLWPTRALAEECRLHVDAGALSARMIALLAKEVPRCEVVTSSGAATLTLAIMRADGHLDVDMIAPPATPVLARRVAIDEGDPEPALRRIALLAARAVESSSHLEPFEVESEQPVGEEGLHLSAGASFVTHGWRTPSDPQFGPALSVTLDLGDFDFGLYGAFFIPTDRSLQNLEARASELTTLVRGGWMPLVLGPVSFGLDLGAGFNHVWLTARPNLVRVGETDRTEKNAVEGIVRGGVVIEARLVGDRLHAFVRGGGLVRIGEVQLEVPEDYADQPIRTGVFVPWGELGVAVRFF